MQRSNNFVVLLLLKSKSGSLVILLSASTTIPGKCNNEEVNELNCFRIKHRLLYFKKLLTVGFSLPSLSCSWKLYSIHTTQYNCYWELSVVVWVLFVTSTLFLTLCGLKNGRWWKINSQISPILISPIIKPLLCRGWIISKSSGFTIIIKKRKLLKN